MSKALIAMSGGVDSSVAAALMKRRGYECVGAMMKLLPDDPEGAFTDSEKDARAVCERLGMELVVLDLSAEFRREVIERFVGEYERGNTPNPCIECNRSLKFGELYRRAMAMSCDTLVTGHYARVEFDESRGRFLLKKARCAEKDQSYVLYSLTQRQLAHVAFPLGEFSGKDAVRDCAAELGLASANKRESQDICFVPDGDYAGFIRRHTGRDYPPGDFVDLDGKALGRHRGIICYTVGQRKGLGIAYSEPLFVRGRSVGDNTVILATARDMTTKELLLRDFNLISLEEMPREPLLVSVRTRYQAKEQPALASALPDGSVRVRFAEPVRIPAPGQAGVLYDGDVVVGGGTIQMTDYSFGAPLRGTDLDCL